MKITDAEDFFVFKTKINLTEDGKEFVELREPTQQEISGLSEDSEKNMAIMEKVFPTCVIDSSFELEDGTKADGKAVYKVLQKSGSLFTEILATWIQSVPFNARLTKGGK